LIFAVRGAAMARVRELFRRWVWGPRAADDHGRRPAGLPLRPIDAAAFGIAFALGAVITGAYALLTYDAEA
jgi:hypothetical protein